MADMPPLEPKSTCDIMLLQVSIPVQAQFAWDYNAGTDGAGKRERRDEDTSEKPLESCSPRGPGATEP
jgi:hypothetical protein